jgi:phage virion morphogenesis protein
MSIEIRGLDRLQRDLSNIIGNLENQEPLMLDISQTLETATERSFEDENSPFGERWKRSKRAERTGTKTLRDTTSSRRRGRGNGQHLQDSINSSHGQDYAKIGTVKKYGKFHQWGTSKMVKRPFIPIDESGNIPNDLAEEIISVASEYILDRG